MKAEIFVTRKCARNINLGHGWVFDNEIERVTGEYANGDIVKVKDSKDRVLGLGFINNHSKIRVRILTRNKKDKIDRAFFRSRLVTAWEYRKKVTDINCCRLVFGEADLLPGLVIDKFDDVLVVQSLALGIDQYKEIIVEELLQILKADGVSIRGVYERSDAKVRELEGLEPRTGFIGEAFDTSNIVINENGIKYKIDIEDGQKTGFFLDQKENRKAIQKYAKDGRVLECFTYTGSFGLNAALGGAKEVTAVDISKHSIKIAEENARLNGFEDVINFVNADVFDLLPQLVQEKQEYDLVILDPPAFTKSSATVKSAVRGYKEINLRAMRLVKDGGYLATCSCSHFMKESLFIEMLEEAAVDAGVLLRQVEFRIQSPDHPVIFGGKESYYLKFIIFQVLRRK